MSIPFSAPACLPNFTKPFGYPCGGHAGAAPAEKTNGRHGHENGLSNLCGNRIPSGKDSAGRIFACAPPSPLLRAGNCRGKTGGRLKRTIRIGSRLQFYGVGNDSLHLQTPSKILKIFQRKNNCRNPKTHHRITIKLLHKQAFFKFHIEFFFNNEFFFVRRG